MNPKTILTEEGWDEVAPDCKGKDKELKRALMFYWSLEDDDFEFRGKALGKIAALAGTLKAANEVKSDRNAVKHLTDVISASKVKQGELIKAKAEAEKAKAVAAKTLAMKAEADAKKQEAAEKQKAAPESEEAEDEEEDDTGDAYSKLTKALQTLKTSKVPYYFLFCKDKPYGLIVSKRDITKSALHKKELSKMAGGSTTPPKFGQCTREGNKLIFEMEKPVPGMARILQKWIKEATSLGLKVMVGTESAEDEEGDAAAVKEGPRVASAAEAAAPPVPPALAKAPEVWSQTRQALSANINQLKAAVRKEFAAEGADLVAEIEQNMKKLDGILGRFDDRLESSLGKAQAARNAAARQAELNNSKALLADYIKFVKSEPLIAHIDSNPFGVKTNLRQTLTESLTKVARAIG